MPQFLMHLSTSTSGMTESVKTRGMFTFVLTACAVNLLRTYSKAKCLTANDLFSFVQRIMVKLINLWCYLGGEQPPASCWQNGCQRYQKRFWRILLMVFPMFIHKLFAFFGFLQFRL
jgi:hypothetical protein